MEAIFEAAVPIRSFTYDDAGKVISEDRDGDIYSYTYNAANRMSSMTLNGVLQAEYVYNALGQQVIRRLIPSGQTIHSIFDLDGNRIAEYDYDDAAGTSSLIREYVWMNGLPVAVIEGGVTYYVRTDHIGRPVFATDSTGTKVWEAIYLPFGGVMTSTGNPMQLRFPGQWFQSESGLHQNWMRDYDPTTGRYMQADPLGLVDGVSVYGYARQNPGRYTDPRGEEAAIPWGRAGTAAAGAGGLLSGVAGAALGLLLYPSAIADGTLPQSSAMSESGEICEACPPCTPYQKGTIGYQLHTGHTHYPAGDPHLNLYNVGQNLRTCKCFWNQGSIFGDAINPPALAGWVDLTPYGRNFPPLTP